MTPTLRFWLVRTLIIVSAQVLFTTLFFAGVWLWQICR